MRLRVILINDFYWVQKYLQVIKGGGKRTTLCRYKGEGLSILLNIDDEAHVAAFGSASI